MEGREGWNAEVSAGRKEDWEGCNAEGLSEEGGVKTLRRCVKFYPTI